jgi:hypothetical protein
VSLPEYCSLKVSGNDCKIPPSDIVSIITQKKDQYMVGLVCKDHKEQMQRRLEDLQTSKKIPLGSIKFEGIKMVMTDCIKGTVEDYVDLELNRNKLSHP